MRASNRGKEFETRIKEAFQRVPHVSIDRIHDQTTMWKGSTNGNDFTVYKKPYEYYIECKSIRGNTFPLSNITEKQWETLVEKSEIDGVFAGVIIWFIERDVTFYVPIRELANAEAYGRKSIRYDEKMIKTVPIKGVKKRVFWEYDLTSFFTDVDSSNNLLYEL